MAKKKPELVACPACGSKPGERCTTGSLDGGRIPLQIFRAHASRYEALKVARAARELNKEAGQ